MPRESTSASSFLPKAEILTFEELVSAAEVFIGLGVRKIRITGGEPLLRRDLASLIERLAALDVTLALTTNGVLLDRFASSLKRAGLHRITVSLDALEPDVFQRMSDAPGWTPEDVLSGIRAAERAGFESIKVNCVVRRGINEHQVKPLLEHFSGTGVVVRFIEYMDVGTQNGWNRTEVVTTAELLRALEEDGELSRVPRERESDVAEEYLWKGSRVGFISSVSAPFCGNCSRARLTADGAVYSCLFGQRSLDARAILRAGGGDPKGALKLAMVNFWGERAERYSEERSEQKRLPVLGAGRAEMSRLGG